MIQTGLLIWRRRAQSAITRSDAKGWLRIAAPRHAGAAAAFQPPMPGERRLGWSTFSFAEVRAIRGALGGTVNDVALTVRSGAVSRYVESHGQPTKIATRDYGAVSLRQDEQRGALGNLVSLLPVEFRSTCVIRSRFQLYQ